METTPRLPRYLTYLELLQQEQRAVGLVPQRGCSPDEVAATRERVRQTRAITLPAEYLEFLGRSNGFAENGTVLFSVDQERRDHQNLPGLLAENARWIPTLPGAAEAWVLLGFSDLWLYAYGPAEGCYVALEPTDGQVVHRFRDFDDFMTSLLCEALGLEEGGEEPPDEEASIRDQERGEQG